MNVYFFFKLSDGDVPQWFLLCHQNNQDLACRYHGGGVGDVFLNKPDGQKGEKNNDSRLVSQVIITRFSNKVPNSQARFLMWQIQ